MATTVAGLGRTWAQGGSRCETRSPSSIRRTQRPIESVAEPRSRHLPVPSGDQSLESADIGHLRNVLARIRLSMDVGKDGLPVQTKPFLLLALVVMWAGAAMAEDMVLPVLALNWPGQG